MAGGFFGYQEEDQVGDLFGFHHAVDGDLADRAALCFLDADVGVPVIDRAQHASGRRQTGPLAIGFFGGTDYLGSFNNACPLTSQENPNVIIAMGSRRAKKLPGAHIPPQLSGFLGIA